MSRQLVLAAALLTLGIGGASAQQVSTPTIWGAPYHGPISQPELNEGLDGGAVRQIENINRGNGKLMALDTNDAPTGHKGGRHNR